MRTGWLDDREDRAWRGYRKMRTLLDLQLARDLDYDVLSTLSEIPGSSMRLNDLAQRMLWSKSRLSHQARRMETRGLLDRQEDAAGRAASLTLTKNGWAVLRGAAPKHVESVRQHFLNWVTAEQLDAFAEFSSLVIQHLCQSATTEVSTTENPNEIGHTR
jgi:DNA-binding MarR family transcriptional regulator